MRRLPLTTRLTLASIRREVLLHMLVVPEAVIIQILEDYGCDLDFAINQCLDAVGDEEVDGGGAGCCS